MTRGITPGEGGLGAQTALSPSRAFLGIAGMCGLGVVLVLAFDRPGAEAGATAAAIAAQGGLCILLALSYRLEQTSAVAVGRTVLLATVGLLTAFPGYYFGPNGSFAAIVVLLLLLAGVLSDPSALVRRTGWLVYATIAGSQAIVFVLIATREVPDTSFTPVILGTRPMISHTLGHLFVQGIYLASYLVGRGFAKRYRALAQQVEAGSRSEAIRDALLEEARAEYRRALRLGRAARQARGSAPPPAPPAAPAPATMVARKGATPQPEPEVEHERTVTEVAGPPPASDWDDAGPTRSSAPSEPSRPSLAELPLPALPPQPAIDPAVTGESAWAEASVYRMRRVGIFTVVTCLLGALLLFRIAVHREPLYVAWACLAGIAVAMWVHNRSWSLGPDGWWAWTFAAVLSVGPAYSVGLHSGFAGIASALLFMGGLFRAPDRAHQRDKRWRVYVGTATAHATGFALVFGGVLPDLGNVPVLLPGVPEWQILAQHLVLQAAYGASYVAGVRVDRRMAALMIEAESAARRGARQEAILAAATAEIDRLLGKAAEAILEGQQVGRWKLEKLLGRGGMGDVYEASDDAGTRAAVKVIKRERASDPSALALFAAEARALERVRSDFVTRIFETAVETELPYLAMERVEGRTLWAVLKERKQLTLDETRELVRDVARGLRDVHEAGVLHRDLKPQNVVRTGEGAGARWKLLDFGVAQIHDVVGPADAAIAGTPRYMAPEQALGERIDARADLYSLGLVIYRALTGRPAYLEDDRELIARAALARAAPDPRWYAPLPRDVGRVLRIALAAQRENRFASASELAAAFESACEDRLSPHHRARADAILSAQPWSTPARAVLPAEAPEPSTHISPG